MVAFRERIIRCLAHVARERPDAVHPVSGAVTDRLDDPASPLVPAATVCLAQLVADDPDPYLRHVWPVAELLGAGDGATRRHAAHVLADLAAAHPVAVAGVVPVLREHLDDDPAVATKVSAAIGRVAGERPEAVRLTVPELVSCLDHRTRPVRTNVAGALADVAGASPELVGEAVPSLVERFDDDAVTVRRNAVTAVLRVADERPVLAARARGGIIELLDDPDATVRRSACTTLGYMSDTLAIELLREVARTDPDASVRSSARWAVEHIS